MRKYGTGFYSLGLRKKRGKRRRRRYGEILYEYLTYGAYTENGKAVENVSLVYFLVYMEDSDVESIVSEAKKELNLKSVLIQESTDKFKLIEGSN